MDKIIRIHPNDNVCVALFALAASEQVQSLTVLEDIPPGHKAALCDIKAGENIIKYGMPIGTAVTDIKKGSHVHTHNVKTKLGSLNEYQYHPQFENIKITEKERTVMVYKRKFNRIGIRNELWVIPTVGCINDTAKAIVERFKQEHDTTLIDGVFAFTHPYGCSQLGDDHEQTKKALQAMVKHPNAGGVLVLGLGCENNQLQPFKETLGEYDASRVRFLNLQDVGDEMEAGQKLLEELFEQMKQDKRSKAPVSELVIGLKCGGSDGLSGITANPLLGAFSDYLTYYHGTTVLTEVPEMFGAETLLMNRAKDERVFQKTVALINDFKAYFKQHGEPVSENPSPGNKEGGITTLEDKSLGCVQKGGTSPVCDVLQYAQPCRVKGLNLLQAPGNDLVSTTALGLSGCHLVLFTTGRGTPFGGFIPTVKVSSNTALFNRKPNWIDFNAGGLVEGVAMTELLVQFIDYIAEIASGRKTNNEKQGFREISIFKTGITL